MIFQKLPTTGFDTPKLLMYSNHDHISNQPDNQLIYHFYLRDWLGMNLQEQYGLSAHGEYLLVLICLLIYN